MKKLRKSFIGTLFLVALIAVGAVLWFQGRLDRVLPYVSLDIDKMMAMTEKKDASKYTKVKLTGNDDGEAINESYTFTDGEWLADAEYEKPHGNSISTSIYSDLQDFRNLPTDIQSYFTFKTNSRQYKIEHREKTDASNYTYMTYVYNRDGALIELRVEIAANVPEYDISINSYKLIYFSFS